MNFLINFPLHGKRQKNLIEWEKSGRLVPRKIQQNLLNVQNLGNWYSYFSHSMFAFFPLDLHLMVYFIICEIHGPPHQFSIAWEYAANSIELRKPGKLVPIFSATYVNFSSIRFPSYGTLYQMGKIWLFPSISNSTENATKSTLWATRLFFHNIIVSNCSKIWWILQRTNRKNR